MGGIGETGSGEDVQGGAVPLGPGELSDSERAVLDFESRRWKHRALKDRAIRERLGMEPIDYYLSIDALLRDSRAHAEYPALMARLSLQVDRDRLRP